MIRDEKEILQALAQAVIDMDEVAAAVMAKADAVRPMAGGRLVAAANDMARRGLLVVGDRWVLTDAGFLIADRLIVEFMDALEG